MLNREDEVVSRRELRLLFSATSSTSEFERYGSVFGFCDSHKEVVDKSTLFESIKKGGLPKLLLQHSPSMVGGIGFETRKDEKCLFICGNLCLEIQAG